MDLFDTGSIPEIPHVTNQVLVLLDVFLAAKKFYKNLLGMTKLN